MKTMLIAATVLLLQSVTVYSQETHEEGEEESGAVHLSVEQINNAGIVVAPLLPAIQEYRVYAPGDIHANDYTSYLVSPRVDSIILRRHVALGEHVVQGAELVTLFSETVAEAQSAFLTALTEKNIVDQLGRQAVGESRFVTSQSRYGVALGQLKAFGLSDADIAGLDESATALGEYTLRAEISGSVLSDDFRQGQRVEAGHPLIELSDESTLWVEARLPPSLQLELPAGAQAVITVAGETYTGTVSQEAHTIDPQTRTRIVRLEVANVEDALHPGQFADVYFSFPTQAPVMAVPESALIRGGDGDWTIYVEHEPGEFTAVEIVLGRTLGERQEISGIDAGTRVVMEGAFFISSEAAKSGFDIHNH